MSIEIVAVDLTEMHRTALLSRAKSPHVRALYEAMFSLKPGEAKAVIAEPGEDLSQIRNLVTQCAARANIDLQIIVRPDRRTSTVHAQTQPVQVRRTPCLRRPARPRIRRH